MSASVLIEAVEAERFGGGCVVAAASGMCRSPASLMAAMMAARMVARLAGPLPVRLVAVSSVKVTSRMWWCASMLQCSRTRRARSAAVACALVRLVMA